MHMRIVRTAGGVEDLPRQDDGHGHDRRPAQQ
jgi:hypothetical protein